MFDDDYGYGDVGTDSPTDKVTAWTRWERFKDEVWDNWANWKGYGDE